MKSPQLTVLKNLIQKFDVIIDDSTSIFEDQIKIIKKSNH